MYDTKDEAKAAWALDMQCEMRRRLYLLQNANTNDKLREMVMKRTFADNADALIHFVNDWCWSIDPRQKQIGASALPRKTPFIPWKEQEEFLRAMYEQEISGENLLVEKSRDTGATWMWVYYATWRWLSSDYWAGGMGNRKQDLIDRKGDMKSIFEKIRFTLDALPKWMLPEGFTTDGDYSNHMRIINPVNGSTLTGESGRNIGRGDRCSVYWVDEFGAIEYADDIEAALSATTDSLFYCSTTTPMHTRYAQLRHSGNVRVHIIKWDQDPRKWKTFREEWIKKYSEIKARFELDCEYTGGDENSFIPADWVKSAINLNLDVDTGGYSIQSGFDVAGTGADESCIVTRQGPYIIDIVAWDGLEPYQGGMRAIKECERNNIDVMVFDPIGVGASLSGQLDANDPDFAYEGFMAGGKTRQGYLKDAPGTLCEDRFTNAKAEAWWELRLRFQNSHRYANGETDIDPADCISIPHDNDLIQQLSAPLLEIAIRNRVKVESKRTLLKRGVKSPDRADACVMAFLDVGYTTRGFNYDFDFG